MTYLNINKCKFILYTEYNEGDKGVHIYSHIKTQL